MKPKVYMLAFDPYKTNAGVMHSAIITVPNISDWWHYLGSAYLFTSTASADDIQNHINQIVKGQFLLAEIIPSNTGGWLPQLAWNWINSKR
jgi:hypothetical protein